MSLNTGRRRTGPRQKNGCSRIRRDKCRLISYCWKVTRLGCLFVSKKQVFEQWGDHPMDGTVVEARRRVRLRKKEEKEEEDEEDL